MLFKHTLFYGKHFSPDGDGGGGGAATGDNGGDGDQAGDGDAGTQGDDVAGLKSALDKERKAARDAAKQARDLQKELDGIKTERDKAAEDEAAQQGKWKELAEKRETDLASVTTDRDAVTAERDALAAYFDTQYSAALKDLPEPILAFQPDETATFAVKSAWLTKAVEQAKKLGAATAGGSRQNPPANGAAKIKVPSVLPKSKLMN